MSWSKEVTNPFCSTVFLNDDESHYTLIYHKHLSEDGRTAHLVNLDVMEHDIIFPLTKAGYEQWAKECEDYTKLTSV